MVLRGLIASVVIGSIAVASSPADHQSIASLREQVLKTERAFDKGC